MIEVSATGTTNGELTFWHKIYSSGSYSKWDKGIYNYFVGNDNRSIYGKFIVKNEGGGSGYFQINPTSGTTKFNVF